MFRHSATLLGQKLVIFGGQMTAAYLNDLHVLDLGKQPASMQSVTSLSPSLL